MDWSRVLIPPMQREARFGDRLVPAFCERPRSIWAMVADAVARNPDGEALICGDRRMTWREVAQQSARIAAGMQKLGLQTGDRVALLAPNCPEYFELQFACGRLGAIMLPLNWRLTVPELEYILGDSSPKLLVHDKSFAAQAKTWGNRINWRPCWSWGSPAPPISMPMPGCRALPRS